MSTLRTVLATVACGWLLLVVTREINHAFASAALSVFTFGLPLAFAALRLDFTSGWRSVICLGLMADALAPVRFGLHALLYLVIFLLIFRVRQRVPREENLVGTVISILATVVVHAAFTLNYIWYGPTPGRLMSRVLMEAGLSSLLVALVAPWYFSFTEHVLSWFGVDLRRETRGLF
ncbi:MAG: hypothetical protein SFV32_12370 [Opitutaceae bacterium]|nr:hypothetical protein [Opitutaceae bacterium]